MADFKVEIEAFDTAVSEYTAAKDEMVSIRNELLKVLETLKTNGWNSVAGEAFFEKYNNDWVKNIDLYTSIIDLMNTILIEAKGNFNDLVTDAQKLNYKD
ncbi:hypothetical protein [uncultured Clostridium sp.]|uniref:hypothetical protein n=1 Tax=uncultured Clostridium sp. TaxID=59620 RepID=UPI0025F18F98|nr:hypothetical protein [uncultured Clostridium sp.]